MVAVKQRHLECARTGGHVWHNSVSTRKSVHLPCCGIKLRWGTERSGCLRRTIRRKRLVCRTTILREEGGRRYHKELLVARTVRKTLEPGKEKRRGVEHDGPVLREQAGLKIDEGLCKVGEPVVIHFEPDSIKIGFADTRGVPRAQRSVGDRRASSYQRDPCRTESRRGLDAFRQVQLKSFKVGAGRRARDGDLDGRL